jgi:hypothetical protein
MEFVIDNESVHGIVSAGADIVSGPIQRYRFDPGAVVFPYPVKVTVQHLRFSPLFIPYEQFSVYINDIGKVPMILPVADLIYADMGSIWGRKKFLLCCLFQYFLIDPIDRFII